MLQLNFETLVLKILQHSSTSNQSKFATLTLKNLKYDLLVEVS